MDLHAHRENGARSEHIQRLSSLLMAQGQMNDPFLHIIGSVIDHTILSQVASLFNLLFPGSIFYHQFFKIIQIIGQVNAGDNMRLCPFHLFTSRSPAFFARLSYYLHLTSGFPGMSIIYLYGKAFAYRYTFFRNRLPTSPLGITSGIMVMLLVLLLIF